eukprot:TRINITY_DN2951_c0_g1_i4.p1 TRINITY_DN2951_c0_g1~~TRINITY_DN2951_c0_g1_i4.p1  ORF type:complete len:501 (+),score=88.64 TRINITY_DN2951_c0_g1_i4:217-1503(+)
MQQQLQQQMLLQQQQQPIVIGGMEFSREDDIGNMEKLTQLFGQVFYTQVLNPGNPQVEEAWRGLQSDVWSIAKMAHEVPALALAVAMVLYNYFWWQGPHTTEVNTEAAYQAATLMHTGAQHAGCYDRRVNGFDFFVRQCHMRFRYIMLLAGETGRYLVLQRRDLAAGAKVMTMLQGYFQEMQRLPNAEFVSASSPYNVNFNVDYFPAAVARHGPVWQNPTVDLPLAKFLEDNYPVFRAELDAVLANGNTFLEMDEKTRNAETQFGPRGDDWLTAYMFRKGKAIEDVCKHVPKTCALLATRPEIAKCEGGGSGAGLLRMRPGGRLKPHFGNAPRLSVHLGLRVPAGEISMSVGNVAAARWREGKALVFDDTFIHQVRHNGIEPRYVLNAWICHPCDPYDGKGAGEQVPEYCHGEPGAMEKLGLQAFPRT